MLAPHDRRGLSGMRLLIGASLVACLASEVLTAQASRLEGEWVRITLLDRQAVPGRLLALGPDVVVLRTSDSGTVTIRRDLVRLWEVSTGSANSAAVGAVIGGGVGLGAAALGTATSASGTDAPAGSKIVAAAAFTAIGVGAGALLGLAIPRTRWRVITIDGLPAGVGLGLCLTLRPRRLPLPGDSSRLDFSGEGGRP